MDIDSTTDPRELKKQLRSKEKRISKLEKKLESLENKYAKKSLQADLFKEIKYITAKNFEVDRFLERMMDKILVATETLSATLLLLDETNRTLEFAVVKGPGSEKLRGTTMPADEGIAGKVIATAKPHTAQSVQKDPEWSSRVADEIKYSTDNLLAVPLKVKGKIRGVIEIINKQNGQLFNDNDITLLKSLSTEVALAFDNARLVSESKRRADEFRTLSRLSTILNSSLDQQSVRLRAMEAVVELLDCETGSLYLIDEEKNELYFEVALGEKGEAVREIRLKIGEGVAGWVAQEGKSDLVPDTALDPRWASRVDKKSKFETLNMITVPVKNKNKVIGVLQAINKRHGRNPSKFDLKLLESLSDQVAIALENARLYEEQKAMFKETAEAITTAIEKRDPYTGGHSKRVRDFCMAAAKYMNLPSKSVEWLELSAILHDTGKIGVDDKILRKPGRLTDDEFDSIKRHPGYGRDILRHVKSLEPIIPGMKMHHERYDGKGYPDGLRKSKIPLLARIINVADTWDAMTSDRPYRNGLSDDIALDELKKFAGTQFDPKVVKAFLTAYENGEITSFQSDAKKASVKNKKTVEKAKPKGYKE
ncbi:MAG: GAF domain-containing protein [Proteobacteria bacterium]|nr:GAF domain-containing protein [Pseudomonadota bacterium]